MNWLLISRFSVISKGFDMDAPMHIKQAAKEDLKDLMARSINVVLNRFRDIDNIILVSDGGSWRKSIPVPSCLGDNKYKGNRDGEREATNTDWKYVFDILGEFIAGCREVGLTCSTAPDIEGDDWVWYWTHRLNSEGTNCIIWSSDNDLKQLVRVDPNTSAYTVWYNDKNGVWIDESLRDDNFDPLDFFMKPQVESISLSNIKSRAGSINYFNPMSIVIKKIFTGDSGDNVKPVARMVKNNRTYGLSEKELNNILETYPIEHASNIDCYRASQVIKSIKKYKDIPTTEIEEMIPYNRCMVWLDESVIPSTIIQSMSLQEYKEYDINYIRNNYKILKKDSSEEKKMTALFEGCPF